MPRCESSTDTVYVDVTTKVWSAGNTAEEENLSMENLTGDAGGIFSILSGSSQPDSSPVSSHRTLKGFGERSSAVTLPVRVLFLVQRTRSPILGLVLAAAAEAAAATAAAAAAAEAPEKSKP
jgi:hypothetical protein